jgi:methylglyoxal/glyoxal reductase
MLRIDSMFTLGNEVEIPRVGLGVYQSRRGSETVSAVKAALEAGYRHVDTAQIYGNEADVGAAIRDSGLDRSDVFVTSKLWNDNYPRAADAFEQSLSRLGLEYVDLFLLHWPVSGRRLDAYRALETLVQTERLRAIGVSNFTVRHLEALLEETSVVPAVNQVELSPYLQQPELVSFCRDAGIALQAYSPLTRGQRLTDPALIAVAEGVGRTPAQVLIRWGLQKDFIVLPKSVTPSRIVENADVFDFELDDAQMAQLDALEEGLRLSWDPTRVP